MQHGRTDEAYVVGEQRTRKPTHHSGNHKTSQAVAIGREADRLHAPVVRTRALDHKAEARIHNPPAEIDAAEEQCEAEIIELGAIAEIDQVGKLAFAIDGLSVVATIAIESNRNEIGHLRKGERDHDEIDAARTQRERANDECKQGGGKDSNWPLQEAGCDAFEAQNSNRIAADAKIDGVTKTHHTAIA